MGANTVSEPPASFSSYNPGHTLPTKTMVIIVACIVTVVVLVVVIVVIRLLRRRAKHIRELRSNAFGFDPAFPRDMMGQDTFFSTTSQPSPRPVDAEEGRGKAIERTNERRGSDVWIEGSSQEKTPDIREISVDPLTVIDSPIVKEPIRTPEEDRVPSTSSPKPPATKPRRKPRLAAIVPDPAPSEQPSGLAPPSIVPPVVDTIDETVQDDSPRSKLRPSSLLRELVTSARSSFSGRGSFSAPRGSISEAPSNFPKMMQLPSDYEPKELEENKRDDKTP